MSARTYGEQKAWFAAQLEFINKMIRQLEDQRKVVEQRRRELERQ